MASQTSLRYVEGDLFDFVPGRLPTTEQDVFIPHVCNNCGLWGKGFVVPLGKKWPAVKQKYRQAYINGPFQIGWTQCVPVTPGITVCNMVAQEGIYPRNGVPPIRYEALEECMAQVAAECDTADFPTIHAPLFGAGLAGGSWTIIEDMIRRLWLDRHIPVTIYYLDGTRPVEEKKGVAACG